MIGMMVFELLLVDVVVPLVMGQGLFMVEVESKKVECDR